MFNVVVNQQGICTVQDRMSTNATLKIEEGATTGMTKICKDLLNNEFKWKICICIYIKNGT